MSKKLWVMDAGVMAYGEAVALQERLRQARQEGSIPDVLMLVEHPPVITLGRAAHEEHLLASRELLRSRGVELHEAARGGDVTYHGPGQLVGYPIMDLNGHGRDVHRYLRAVEETLIQTLATYGLEGSRVSGLTGVWVGNEKAAAIGVGVRRWITWHGFALNISTNLDAFSLIVPCGIRDRGVTSLERLLHRSVDRAEVETRVIECFAAVFGVEPERRGVGDAPISPAS